MVVTVTNLVTARQRLAQEWSQANPQTPAEIASFYRDSELLGVDLAAWHALPERLLWTQAICEAADRVGARRILDCGAGLGQDLLALREQDSSRTLVAIEPNDRLRAQLQGKGLRAVQDIAELLGEESFDFVICVDVLEHIPDPDELLRALIALVRVGGALAIRSATTDLDTPLHLPHLRAWHPGRLLDRYGFGYVQTVAGGLECWRRENGTRDAAVEAIICSYRGVSPDTLRSLIGLVNQGWRYTLHSGDALISRARSIAASQWLRWTDGDVFLMVDDDIGFTTGDAEAVVSLAREHAGIACAPYLTRDRRHLAQRLKYDQEVLDFGTDGGPQEILYAATGFMAVHRSVLETMIKELGLPFCHPREVWGFWPFFQPFVVEDSVNGYEYLSEDWALCERARRLGFQVWMDSRIILNHAGVTLYDSKGESNAAM